MSRRAEEASWTGGERGPRSSDRLRPPPSGGADGHSPSVAAVLAGLTTREAALIAITVLVGQPVLGWHNDLVDQPPSTRRHEREGKPISDGPSRTGERPGLHCARGVLLVIPLSVTSGTVAGLFLPRLPWLARDARQRTAALPRASSPGSCGRRPSPCYPGVPLWTRGWLVSVRGRTAPLWLLVALAAACSVSRVHFLTSHCGAWWPTTRTSGRTCRSVPGKMALPPGARQAPPSLRSRLHRLLVIAGMLYAPRAPSESVPVHFSDIAGSGG